jgi:peptide/nickel transport system substrate-binding protein
MKPCEWSTRLIAAGILITMLGCHDAPREAGTVVVIIESSPNNLDPRQGTDAQSERVGPLIFDALVKKDAQYNLTPWLATSWEQQPDGSAVVSASAAGGTASGAARGVAAGAAGAGSASSVASPAEWVFHLRDGVRFQDGRPLEAADVVWTIESLIDPALTAKLAGGTLVSPKAGAFANVARVEARDRLTVVVHMKRPDAGLVFNLSDEQFGVVPRGSGADFGMHPMGSGPYRFVSQVQDKDVVVERWPGCWSAGLSVDRQRAHSDIQRIEFDVVPDTITSALELQKGSADAASNVLTPDMVYALRDAPGLATASGRGANVFYLNFNVTDPLLRDKRVRQAIALSIDRATIVATLDRGHARLADTMLPPGHWARAADAELAQYPYDPVRARALLDAAGYRAGKDGVRLTLTLKISTDESTRLLAAVLQQQMRAVGIALNLRSAEFGTFYADVTHGAFQMYVLKWVGSNEDPDIFRYMYSSQSFPPKGGNRGHYVNPQLDALLAKAAAETGPADEVQARRRTEYVEVQKILAEEVPSVPLWYSDNEVVHTRRLKDVVSDGDGNFDFLR